MKTVILTAAMMILMTAATLNAAPDSTKSVITKEQAFKAAVRLQADVIQFRVAKPAGEKVSLIIYGEKNNKVYQRTLRREKGIALDCDMTDMNKGTYTCIIERDGKEVVRKPITVD